MDHDAATNIESHRITEGPPCMYYFADFLTEDEERGILQKIPANRWTSLSHRRLQAVPTQLTANNTLLASALPDWLLKPAVQRIEQLGFFRDAPHGINHCLINEYLPGQGIMPHEDGDAYFPVVATVSLGGSLVLDVTQKKVEQQSRSNNDATSGDTGSQADRMQSEKPTEAWRVLQEPRSLLVTSGAAYTDTLHGIASVDEDTELSAETVVNWTLLGQPGIVELAGGCNQRTERISLTFRDVKRVSKLGKMLLGRRS